MELSKAVRQVAARRHVLDSRIVLPKPPLGEKWGLATFAERAEWR